MISSSSLNLSSPRSDHSTAQRDTWKVSIGSDHSSDQPNHQIHAPIVYYDGFRAIRNSLSKDSQDSLLFRSSQPRRSFAREDAEQPLSLTETLLYNWIRTQLDLFSNLQTLARRARSTGEALIKVQNQQFVNCFQWNCCRFSAARCLKFVDTLTDTLADTRKPSKNLFFAKKWKTSHTLIATRTLVSLTR